MSRRFVDQTAAKLMPDGRPSFELVTGWDPPTSSYYVHIVNTKTDEAVWTRGTLGDLPTFDDLMEVFAELANERLIQWPMDPVLLEVLMDDKSQNLLTNKQDWDEVERRKGLLGNY